MKNRMLITVLVVALSAALIGGATMAWFTDSATTGEAEFTAGTVVVDAKHKSTTPMEGRFIDNVNPGDCATVCWDIVNEGTKSAELRVKVDAGWVNSTLNDSQVAFFAPEPDSGWVMYEEEGEMWLYYTGGPVAGTYGDVEPSEVPLCLVVAFDGPGMGNEYKGEDYKIGGTVEAIQSTNGAPEAAWGDAWTATRDGYELTGSAAEYLSYVMNSRCWPEVEVPEYTVRVKAVCEIAGAGTVSGGGLYAVGEAVTVKATPECLNTFKGWTSDDITIPDGTGREFTFTMPAHDVTLSAQFSFWGIFSDDGDEF